MNQDHIVSFLMNVYSDMSREDIEDALQDAAVAALENGAVLTSSYQVRGARFALNNLRRKSKALYLEDWSALESTEDCDDELCGSDTIEALQYDPTNFNNLSIDIAKVLSKHFTPTERKIIYSYFAEGVSTHQIAREHPAKSQRTYYRWLEHKVRPLLQRQLKDYGKVLFPKAELKEAV